MEKHPADTEKFANDLFNRLDLLAAFPYLGEGIKGRPNIKRLLHSPLYIYYRIDQLRESVEILHIWHSSRRPPRL
jgi:plasmid stabilization system protein ParE